jgi:serine-type D-Ala-D-Ala carboxypeptidase/endopeptidase (penicillin-binding protein 4)
MKQVLPIVFCLLTFALSAQTVNQKLQKAFQQFEKDTQLKHAISALYVIDAKTGQVVFDKNSQIGLAPASTQKIITSVTAFELLGKDYRYKTLFFSAGPFLTVLPNEDPTFGSKRYQSTTDTVIFKSVINALKRKGRNSIHDFAIIDKEIHREVKKNVPSGWIYEDIGNYYGSAPNFLNWQENQYDINFIPGDKEGDDTYIDTMTTIWWGHLINNCSTGKKGSGDNAYVYFIPGRRESVIEGTIPAGVKKFTISASDNFPHLTFSLAFTGFASKEGFLLGDPKAIHSISTSKVFVTFAAKDTAYIHYSPTLDSINYWFLKKSINLYGEALIKTLAYEKNGFGATDSGVVIIKNFWKDKGLDPDELNINDGSGLSPMNRVTAHAQVEILKYSKNKNWFPSFYNALPDYNGMKMKSGTIRDVKGFCGYHTAQNGKEYIFSFLVNNYNGKSGKLVQKMYKVLDVLK